MCDPMLVTLLKMRPHYSQSSRGNATTSSGTSPLASYKEVPPPPAQKLLLADKIHNYPSFSFTLEHSRMYDLFLT